MKQILQFNLGEVIKKRMCNNGQSVAWLSRQVNCDRSNMYKILKKTNMNTELLWDISIALKHNFFEDISDELSKQLKNAAE